MLPSATDLSYFHEVAVAGSLSSAANRLNISQPSLSIAIKRLERLLSTSLFNRNKNGVTLTKAGNKLLPHIEEMLSRWNSIKAEVISSHHDLVGTVTLGCHLMMSAYMSSIISQLLDK